MLTSSGDQDLRYTLNLSWLIDWTCVYILSGVQLKLFGSAAIIEHRKLPNRVG
jgi:hypothetical protein